MPDNVPQDETIRWLRYAHEDLESAQLLLASASAPPRHVCLFAQQAAEKAIKGAWVWLAIPIVKTHDIVFLQRRLPDGWRIRLISDRELNALSQWAIESRYPGEETDADFGDAEAAIATAHHVVETVEADLAAVGFCRP